MHLIPDFSIYIVYLLEIITGLMIFGLTRLSQTEIQELRQTIGKITTKNLSFEQLKKLGRCQESSDVYGIKANKVEILQQQVNNKFTVLNNLTGITLNILEDTQKLLQEKQTLQQRSEELLQGLHFLELDYYELREENDRLNDAVAHTQTHFQTLIREKDSTIQKHEELSDQLIKKNHDLEDQVHSLHKQLDAAKSNNQFHYDSLVHKNYSSFEQEILDLKVELYELKKKCQYNQRQKESVILELNNASSVIKDLESKVKNHKEIHEFNCQVSLRKNSEFSVSVDSKQVDEERRMNLHLDLQTMEGCYINDKFLKEPKKIYSFENSQSISNASQYLPDMPEIWMNKDEVSEAGPNSEETSSMNFLKSNEASLILEESENREGSLNQKSMIKTQLVNGQLNKKTKESERIPDEKPMLPTSMNELENPPEKKKFRVSKLLTRARSFNKIPTEMSGSESDHNLKMYKKYRGELQTKYPNLQKFSNKVLEKKIQIINRCATQKGIDFERKNYEHYKKQKNIKVNPKS